MRLSRVGASPARLHRAEVRRGRLQCEIDQRVKALLRDALSVYRVDAERLRELEPDVIVTQSHCEVCAVSLRDVERAVCSWLSACPQLVSLAPNGLADVWTGIERVAEALDVRGTRRRVDSEITEAHERHCGAGEALAVRPTVACIEWIDPLMAAGNWMPELVELAGGVNLFGEAGKHSPWMTWEQLVARDPDVIVVLPCGFDIERSRQGHAGADEIGRSGRGCGRCATAAYSWRTAISISIGRGRDWWNRWRSWRNCCIRKRSDSDMKGRAGRSYKSGGKRGFDALTMRDGDFCVIRATGTRRKMRQSPVSADSLQKHSSRLIASYGEPVTEKDGTDLIDNGLSLRKVGVSAVAP